MQSIASLAPERTSEPVECAPPPTRAHPTVAGPSTHQPQALAPQLTVVLLQLLRLLPQLLVVGRDFLLGLNQVVVGQRLHTQLEIRGRSR